MTGMTSMTIHSVRFSLPRIASIIFRRLVRSLSFCLEPVFSMSPRILAASAVVSRSPRSFLIASAPISASKSSPYFS